jgi:hypothetical protein
VDRLTWSVADPYCQGVADDFCGRYGDLLAGFYDCVDRIVLNAFFPLGHNPGRVPDLVAAAARRQRRAAG